jgi:phosphate transport system permease protein
VIDLLAAVPSIVYGLWGALVLVPHMNGLFGWLDKYLGWTGIFSWQGGAPRSMLTVSILLAIMILPIITNVSREVFRQVPQMHEEAALALGATRWEVIRMSVLPFGRSGVISASMLGLGRALGETMAVATVLSPTFDINASLLDPGGGTFAQNIASKFGEATADGRDALIASGLVLFVITLLVNGAARVIIARRAEYSGANA